MSTQTTIDRLIRAVEAKGAGIRATVDQAAGLIVDHQRQTGDVSRACRLLAALDGMAVQKHVKEYFEDALPHAFRRTADGWRASEKNRGKIVIQPEGSASAWPERQTAQHTGRIDTRKLTQRQKVTASPCKTGGVHRYGAGGGDGVAIGPFGAGERRA